MNKILIQFNITDNFIVNQTGEKTIYIYRIGNEKNYFTIILTYTTNKNYHIQ